jgi:hypothetical protein
MKGIRVAAILGMVLACVDPTAPVPGILEVRASAPVLQLTNQSIAPVYTFAIEAGTAALANWAPCTDPSRCRAIAPGQHTTLPYTAITGYSASAQQAIVFWWHLTPAAGAGFRPDSIRSVIVGL